MSIYQRAGGRVQKGAELPVKHRRLKELKSRILLTERSTAEEADALQHDIELLTVAERQELLAHIHKLAMEARRLVVNLSRNHNTLLSEGGWELVTLL